jgi:hypothetical protein
MFTVFFCSGAHGVDCVACGIGIVGNFITAPCGDTYDQHCLNDLYEAIANGDQSLFPVRCCRQEIPFDTVKDLLSDDLAERYSSRAEEFSAILPKSNLLQVFMVRLR